MKHTLENKTLTLYFEGELNSFNSEDVEREVEALVNSCDFDALRIDMEQVTYISSAGLRIIVRLKQRYNDTALVRVPSDAYAIFEMVGFQNLMVIEKL